MAQPTCKICGAACARFGITDSNRTCEDARNGRLFPIAEPVTYWRCSDCGLVFTPDFDAWSATDFASRIYNDDYVRADPDVTGRRPSSQAQLVRRYFGPVADRVRLLDYGGGSGLLARDLRQRGFADAETYDPFVAEHSRRPERRFNVITCFETLEHVPEPRATARDMAELLDDPGLVFFSTLLQPPGATMEWWYVAPRNGHITLFSLDALKRLWADVGLRCVSFDQNYHAAFRTLPAFAEKLVALARA